LRYSVQWFVQLQPRHRSSTILDSETCLSFKFTGLLSREKPSSFNRTVWEMAEIVGLVASGISIATLAVQIANSLAKLKSYWNDIIEAPEDITLLIEELDGLYHSLADIDKHQHRNPISSTVSKVTSISRCLELCRQAASQLEELTDKLSADINTQHRLKKRWASAKVVFKKDKIKKYKSRLKSAIRLLSISYQCYTT